MNDRDCESCKKFSRVDPHESEGYCGAKRTWVDPQEGEDCKMHEFTLHSATKYKDGTPIMSEPERVVTGCYICKHSMWDSEGCFCKLNGAHPLAPSIGCDSQEVKQEIDNSSSYPKSNQLDELKESAVKLTLRDSYLTQCIDDLDYRVDELTEEYDAVLKTHGDTLEEHLDRICELEHMYEAILDDICVMRGRLCKITELLVGKDEFSHIFSNFCGNCIHAEMVDGLCTCALSGEALDPDYASCSRFDFSFTHVGDRTDWMEKIRKDLTTPSEPTESCKDCNCAKDGMCTKYNCSLGAICATPECFELPF